MAAGEILSISSSNSAAMGHPPSLAGSICGRYEIYMAIPDSRMNDQIERATFTGDGGRWRVPRL
jgi:hypothetical protein